MQTCFCGSVVVASLLLLVLVAVATARRPTHRISGDFEDQTNRNEVSHMSHRIPLKLEQQDARNPPPKSGRFPRGWRPEPMFTHRDQNTIASVVYQQGKFLIVPDTWAPNSLARGLLGQTLNTSGWDVLDLSTGLDTTLRNDSAAMYAAGLLEGYMTGDRIALMYTNMMPVFFPDDYSRSVLLPRVKDFLSRQFQWALSFAANNPQSAVARHTGLVLSQLQGLIDGYLARNDSSADRDPFVLHLLNAVGDMLDLQIALNDTEENYFKRMTQREFHDFMLASGRCSALIRLTPGLERLFMGHSSWFVYGATLRIFKHYEFNLSDADLISPVISFSSYAGFLESLDDFYVLHSGLVVLQTTNNVFNVSLYKSVQPKSLLAWQRVRVANQIARNGSHWAWVMNQWNSGTYNNQYMVIDLNRFTPNVEINDGALTIVEQIPTLVVSSDQTSILRTGYFPSYNVPFHEVIYNMSGYPDVVQTRGLDYSYQMAPRAKIFRREAPRVFDEVDMAGIMRFNNYTDDPYSEKNACKSICCRGDLNPDGSPSGCYDSKFTEYQLALSSMGSYAISGPTTGSADKLLPAFSWKQYPSVSHAGLPYVYNFSWVTTSPLFMPPRK